MVALPEMPTWAHRMQCRPMTTLWPTCTRLSIFVPSPITVRPKRARSTVLPAPISTSSSMTDHPDLRHLLVAAVDELVAKAVGADDDVGVEAHAPAELATGGRGARPA